MNKFTIDNLVIELTRRCNMACDHCLRGCAQNLDLDLNHVRTMLSKCDQIHSITLSGGEPGLAVDKIEAVLELCKEMNVEVGSFYIVTNGTVNQEKLAVAALRWYAYCYNNEASGLAVSTDQYHTKKPDTSIFEGLAFYHEKEMYGPESIIDEGHANSNGIGARAAGHESLEVDYDAVMGMVYLNCKGNVCECCDWSYVTQDEESLCHVNEFWNKMAEWQNQDSLCVA